MGADMHIDPIAWAKLNILYRITIGTLSFKITIEGTMIIGIRAAPKRYQMG